MTSAFESSKNRKAFIYTTIICICLLLLFILISWKVMPPTVPVVQDLIEINLGNGNEGFGPKQPLIKGNRTLSHEDMPDTRRNVARPATTEKIEPDDNAENNAAPVDKPLKNSAKAKPERVAVPVVAPATKPQKPKIIYPGDRKNPPGNNPDEDNDYRSEGDKPGKLKNPGLPDGDKNSDGTTPGAKKTGPKVISGNRKIIYRSYSFKGDLPKATIYAVIKVSADGQGTYLRMVKPSTSFDPGYATSIRDYLKNMEFDKASNESNVTVQFNFTVN